MGAIASCERGRLAAWFLITALITLFLITVFLVTVFLITVLDRSRQLASKKATQL